MLKLHTGKENLFLPGDHSGGEIPVSIPNTEVKPSSADGTQLLNALGDGEQSREIAVVPASKTNSKALVHLVAGQSRSLPGIFFN